MWLYFNYRWINDRNIAFTDSMGEFFMDQLPHDVRIRILRDYMYPAFLSEFKDYFRFINPNIPDRTLCCFTWDDEEYK